MRLRSPSAPELLGAACLAAAAACVVIGHLRFSAPPYWANVCDEGYLAAFGTRMLAGHFLPYVDAVSHRGPVLYWVTSAAIALHRSTPLLAIRCLSVLVWLATLAMLAASGALARHAIAGVTAALALPVVAFGMMDAQDGLAWGGEHLLNSFVVAALLVQTIALRDKTRTVSPASAALCASLCCLAALSKQVGALAIVPPALAFWAASLRPSAARDRLAVRLGFLAGAAAPALLVLGIYAATKELPALWFGLYKYNVIYMSPISPAERVQLVRWWVQDNLSMVALAILAVTYGLARPLFVDRRAGAKLAETWDRGSFEITVALQAAVALASATAPLRFFGHYYVQVIPWFGLLGGFFLERLFFEGLPEPGRRRTTMLATLSVVAGALLLVATHRFVEVFDRTISGGEQRLGSEPVCAVVDELSAPGEPIFVWGFAANLYTSCHRFPASRYVYTTILAGLVPWFTDATPEEDLARIPKGSHRTLLADLEKSRVGLIVDLGDESLGGRPMRNYPDLAQYLDTNYCPSAKRGLADFYARRRPDQSCPEGVDSEATPE